MKYILLLIVSATTFVATAQKLNAPLAKSADLYNKTIVQIKPVFKNYVAQTAKAFTHKKLNVDSLKQTIKAPGNTQFSNLTDVDINTLLYLVTQATATATAADIKNTMAAMEANNKKKEALRKEEQQINEAAKVAPYEDIKNTLNNMDKNRQQKETLKTADSLKLKIPRYSAEQAKRLAAIKKEKDALNEMNEEDMLQLQMMMDKKSQLETMISNMMKKSSETGSGISGNLKG